MMSSAWHSRLVVSSDRLVLVEGQDEVNLLNSILEYWQIEGLQVIDVGGNRQFSSRLDAVLVNARTRSIELSALGLFRDADGDAAGAFRSITQVLTGLSLPVPASHAEFSHGIPSVGVFIAPDGVSQGAIEAVCWESIKETSIGQCASKYLDCVQYGGALLSHDLGKTLVHTFLAAQTDPTSSVGLGALKGYWPLGHEAFDGIKTFLEQIRSS